MDFKKQYLRFITDALLKDALSARKIRRHLKKLQKKDPVVPPHSAHEALEDWYARQHLEHAPLRSASSGVRTRIWIGSATAVMAAFLILMIIVPQSEKFYTTENDANMYTASSEEATAEEDAVEVEVTTDSAETEESAAEGGEDRGTSSSYSQLDTEEQQEEAVVEDKKENLYEFIRQQFDANEMLSITADAAAVQDQPGYLLLSSDVRITVPEDMDLSQYAGKTLTITCDAGLYAPEDDKIVTIQDWDELIIKINE